MAESRGLLYGCNVAAQGTPDGTVKMAAGSVMFDEPVPIAAVDPIDILGSNPADPDQDRYDAITVDETDTLTVLVGTPGVPGAVGDLTGLHQTALVKVRAAATEIDAADITVGAFVFPNPFDLGVFGSGVDGPIHVNANPFTLADPYGFGTNLITANVLQRDCFPAGLTVDAGCELVTNGALIVSSDVVVNRGHIRYDGLETSIHIPYPWGRVIAAGLRATLKGNGGSNFYLGGAGGAGGTGGGGANAGGSAGPLAPSIAKAFPTTLAYLLACAALGQAGASLWIAGGSAASGGGDGTNLSGAGGYAGGLVAIAAPVIDNAGGQITADGQDGETRSVGNVGGGGGGGGGTVWLYGVVLPGTLHATKGVKGLGHGTGTDGTDGADGLVWYPGI